ncbi:hypothetical protein CLF_111874, partial [Clonorchis sinensis]
VTIGTAVRSFASHCNHISEYTNHQWSPQFPKPQRDGAIGPQEELWIYSVGREKQRLQPLRPPRRQLNLSPEAGVGEDDTHFTRAMMRHSLQQSAVHGYTGRFCMYCALSPQVHQPPRSVPADSGHSSVGPNFREMGDDANDGSNADGGPHGMHMDPFAYPAEFYPDDYPPPECEGYVWPETRGGYPPPVGPSFEVYPGDRMQSHAGRRAGRARNSEAFEVATVEFVIRRSHYTRLFGIRFSDWNSLRRSWMAVGFHFDCCLSPIAKDNRSAIQSRFDLMSRLSSVKCRDRSAEHLLKAFNQSAYSTVWFVLFTIDRFPVVNQPVSSIQFSGEVHSSVQPGTIVINSSSQLFNRDYLIETRPFREMSWIAEGSIARPSLGIALHRGCLDSTSTCYAGPITTLPVKCFDDEVCQSRRLNYANCEPMALVLVAGIFEALFQSSGIAKSKLLDYGGESCINAASWIAHA